MAGMQPAFAGDAALERELAASGSAYDAAGVKALLAGVRAAPPGLDPEAWLSLGAASLTPGLRAQLVALADSLDRATGENVSSGTGADRLARLRAELAVRGVQGFLVPRADAHQGEYVPANAQRLAWLTGFTGSAEYYKQHTA